MKIKYSCCFIGHRKILHKELACEKIMEVVKYLITDKGVRYFNFGSKSEFDDICHAVVTELQKIYPDIIRVNYNSKHEYPVKNKEKDRLEKICNDLLKKEVKLKAYEDSKISKRVASAGKASYIERNQDMINASEYCVFYYIKEYVPEKNKNSGTKLAYDYAKRKKKKIINISD